MPVNTAGGKGAPPYYAVHSYRWQDMAAVFRGGKWRLVATIMIANAVSYPVSISIIILGTPYNRECKKELKYNQWL